MEGKMTGCTAGELERIESLRHNYSRSVLRDRLPLALGQATLLFPSLSLQRR